MYGFQDGGLLEYAERDMETVRQAIKRHTEASATNKARFKSIIVEENPIEVFEWVASTDENIEISVSEEVDHYGIELSRKIERSDRIVSGSFALFRHDVSNIWTAVTGCGPDFFKRGIKWILSRGQPELSSFYVSSDDLREVLHTVEKRLSSQIIVNKAVVYSHREEGNISWETRPYRYVFEQSKEGARYVDKLTFSANRNERLFDGFISREGIVKFNGGDVDLFFANLLKAYADTGTDKIELFSDKERSRETGDVKELEIRFDEKVLEDPSDNKKLIKALSDLEKSDISVYHNNPYAHVSILDLLDGSNCDIFVTGSKTISIIPGFKGSLNSLMRISDQIAREFQEGKVVEKYEQEYESSDFVRADA